jgi:hypothetical protein
VREFLNNFVSRRGHILSFLKQFSE